MQDENAPSARHLALIERNRNLRYSKTTPPTTPEKLKINRRELPTKKGDLPMPISTPYTPKSRTLPKIGICVGGVIFILLFIAILFDPTD